MAWVPACLCPFSPPWPRKVGTKHQLKVHVQCRIGSAATGHRPGQRRQPSAEAVAHAVVVNQIANVAQIQHPCHSTVCGGRQRHKGRLHG